MAYSSPLLGAAFALAALPETRNKSITQLEQIFVKKKEQEHVEAGAASGSTQHLILCDCVLNYLTNKKYTSTKQVAHPALCQEGAKAG